MVPTLVSRVLRNEPVLVLGGGGQCLDFPRPVAVRVVGHIALEVGVDRAVFPAFINPPST